LFKARRGITNISPRFSQFSPKITAFRYERLLYWRSRDNFGLFEKPKITLSFFKTKQNFQAKHLWGGNGIADFSLRPSEIDAN